MEGCTNANAELEGLRALLRGMVCECVNECECVRLSD